MGRAAASPLLLLLLPFWGNGADTLWYRTLGVEEGLAQNFVTAIAADGDGFMWFGTAGGLSRWDGQQFENYVPVGDQKTSLSDSVVLALHPGRGGRLWVGTRQGIDCFDPASNAFRQYATAFPNRQDTQPFTVEAIVSDQKGRVWFASFAEPWLYGIDPQTGRGTQQMIPGTSNYWVTALCVDRSDRLWVAMQPRSGSDPAPFGAFPVFRFDHCSDIPDGSLPDPNQPITLEEEGGKVVTMLEDSKGRLWLGRDGGGVSRFDSAVGALSQVVRNPSNPQALAGGLVLSMGLDPAGKVWVLTRSLDSEASKNPDQLYRIDADSLAPHRIAFRRSALLPGDDARVERLSIDHSGVIWLGSNGGGLRYADVSAGGFSLYGKALAGLPGLDSSFVRAICEARDGSVWVGTPLGLNRIDRSAGEPVYSSPSRDGALRLPHPNVQAICEDHEGNLWFGTGGGLAVLEKSSGEVRHYRHQENQPGSLSDDYVLVIHEDPGGRLWVGTLGKGLDEFDRRSRSFRHHRGNPSDPTSLPSGTVLALFTDSQHRLWVGTAAGLARLESPSGEERRFERVNLGPNVPPGAGILTIGESPTTPGLLWIGTQQDGLGCLDVQTGLCRIYTTRNSKLPNDTIYGLLADQRGRLWISSNRGLTCFNPAEGTFKNYDIQDGLQSSEFNGRSYFRSPSGEMFFGGVKGLNSFFPELITDNLNPPRVCITEVRVTERGTRNPDLAATLIYRRGMRQQEVEVPFRLRDVAFDFAALHYAAPARNRCQFKLEPYDRDWHSPTTHRQTRYTNLDPGHYTFRVKAMSNLGVSGAEEATFSFVVLPPFYATLWFRALVAVGTLASALGTHRWRTHTLHRRQRELERQIAQRTEELRQTLATVAEQAEKLKELNAAKSKFFANISHEFRTPLTLTLGPLQDVQGGMHGVISHETRAEIEIAIRNSTRLLELVDQLLMLARLDAGQLEFRPRELRLDEWLRQSAGRYESLARGRQIHFLRELADTSVRGMFDQDKLDQVLSNLLGNAFKFTPPGGTVTLRLSRGADDWATIQVEDSGPGIPAQDLPRIFERFYRGEQENGSLPGTGLGLSVAKECVQLHGGEIRAENRPEGGARFTVRLPASPAAGPLRATPSGAPGNQTQPPLGPQHSQGESSHEP